MITGETGALGVMGVELKNVLVAMEGVAQNVGYALAGVMTIASVAMEEDTMIVITVMEKD